MIKFIRNLLNFHLYIPIPGIGCGVIGLALLKSSKTMGEYASQLLKALEYRGYDSTGAAIQKGKEVTLVKDIGAPSVLVETLGISKMEGKLFCGQVRWATFGKVDKINSQPHIVNCKQHIYGAHNGNITNTAELTEFLTLDGHEIASDNDGEILVHMVEHFFDIELSKYSATQKDQKDQLELRKQCMRKAIPLACDKITGSFGAVIVDPYTEIMYTIKAGSSLYFGVGVVDGQKFALASSDLTAVLKFTKNLVALKEGEFVEYTADEFKVFAFADITVKRPGKPSIIYKCGELIKNKVPVRSKLRAGDITLLPGYKFFMEQEIHASVESSGKLIKTFLGGSNTGKNIHKIMKKNGYLKPFEQLAHDILHTDSFDEQQKMFDTFRKSKLAQDFFNIEKVEGADLYQEVVRKDFEKLYFFSNEKSLFLDLAGDKFDELSMLIAKALDSIIEFNDILEFNSSIQHFIKLIGKTITEETNIYVIACGTSYHASLIGAIYFNEIAGIDIRPVLPGDFRGQYSNCLRDHDMVIGVSQSGETKDLVDIFDDIEALELDITKVMLVNNMNSTLGQEKCDVSIPIACGPEIAVPATKSIINQLVLFFYLALKTLEKKIEIQRPLSDSSEAQTSNLEKMEETLKQKWISLENIPLLIEETIKTASDSVKRVAGEIFLAPSTQILATKISGVAKEGALKIRETVLNHTEGGEASEFKHGPNTILGKNTTYGLEGVSYMVKHFDEVVCQVHDFYRERQIKKGEINDIIHALRDYIFSRSMPFNLTTEGLKLFKEIISEHDFFGPLMRNYPLIYVTGPDERDINLTISQINTHKIRGANTFLIAEENAQLIKNAHLEDDSNMYVWDFIKLPKTGDTMMATISSTVVLQLLSLEMSLKKMQYLDKLEMKDHGVHPDVPKNVSKSITVD